MLIYAPIIFLYASGSNKLVTSNFWVTKTYAFYICFQKIQ